MHTPARNAQVDPKNEATWGSWIQMEEDLGRLEAANELRIRRGEQQWEFVIPSSFTTRPEDGSGSAGAAGVSGSVLQALLGTLNRFFTVRSGGSSSGGGGRATASSSSSSAGRTPSPAPSSAAAASAAGAAAAPGAERQLMAELLPSDFRTDLTLEDIISEAAALDVSAAAGPGSSSSTSSSSSSSSNGDGQRHQQHQQQQQQHLRQPLGGDRASLRDSNGSSSSGDKQQADASRAAVEAAGAAARRTRSSQAFQRQRRQQMSTNKRLQRPVRPDSSGETW
jgi:hypothetical protein